MQTNEKNSNKHLSKENKFLNLWSCNIFQQLKNVIYEKESFLIGVLAGVVLSVIFCFVKEKVSGKDSINYYEQPVSYENEKQVTVKVFQVFKNSALAFEDSYNNKTVLILGENFYTDQYVTIKKPKIIGTYSYTTKNEMPLTVPIIDGKIEK